MRAEFSQFIHRSSHAAAAGGGKGHQSLSGKVIALHKGVDNTGRNIPPDGEAKEHRVVVRQMGKLPGNLRAGGRVTHLHTAAALFVHPVQVGAAVRDFGLDLEQVSARGLCQTLSGLFCRAAGGKVGYQFLAHFIFPPMHCILSLSPARTTRWRYPRREPQRQYGKTSCLSSLYASA